MRRLENNGFLFEQNDEECLFKQNDVDLTQRAFNIGCYSCDIFIGLFTTHFSLLFFFSRKKVIFHQEYTRAHKSTDLIAATTAYLIGFERSNYSTGIAKLIKGRRNKYSSLKRKNVSKKFRFANYLFTYIQ